MYKNIFTVAQVNRYIKGLMAEDALLSGLFVTGELSNVKLHTSGHIYFTLKDEAAALNGVMFKGHAQAIPFIPKNGMRIVAGGYISLYEKTGQYQLYVEFMEPAGIGGLQAAFNQLCEKLRAEGLFDSERKRPLPAYVKTVAIITSPTGAAVWDMIRILRSRNPAVDIVVAPAQVQGEGSAADIARAIREVNAWAGADVIILGRGGGSMEDLWAFNEETTARAVAASAIPVISAVGHETDTVITDFVADMRAPTPTAAAAIAVYSRADTLAQTAALTEALHKGVINLFNSHKNQWQAIIRRRCLQKPLEPVYQRQLHAQTLLKNLNKLIIERLTREKTALAAHTALLEKISPYALWERGYAVVRSEDDRLITSAATLHKGDALRLHFKDGQAAVAVTETIPMLGGMNEID